MSPYGHQTISMATRVKAGNQCGDIFCRMAKTIKNAFSIKIHQFKNGATIRYMGWENALIEMLLEVFPQDAIMTTTEQLYHGPYVETYDYQFNLTKRQRRNDQIESLIPGV